VLSLWFILYSCAVSVIHFIFLCCLCDSFYIPVLSLWFILCLLCQQIHDKEIIIIIIIIIIKVRLK
jgi:hypothetical protein